MNANNIVKTQSFLKGQFYYVERFRDFFSFRPSGLTKTLTYVLMNNFFVAVILKAKNIKKNYVCFLGQK
jgi:hypothetical protein